jgi:hypothetical protein
MRHPVILSSLEEDFEQIGLTEKKPLQEAKTTKEVEVDEDIDFEDLDLEGLDEEQIEELRTRYAAGSMKRVKLKRRSSAERAKSRRWEKAHKSQRKKADKRSAMKDRGKKAAIKKRRARKRRNRREDVEMTMQDQLSSILEDVQNIVSQIDENVVEDNEDIETTIRSFANVAIISEMLSDFFEAVASDEELSEDLDDDLIESLEEATAYFTDLAENAASLATVLNEGEDSEYELPTDDEIAEAFEDWMGALVEGLEFYADLTEDDDADSDLGNELDEADDEEEDDSKMPAFLKKKMAASKKKMGKG